MSGNGSEVLLADGMSTTYSGLKALSALLREQSLFECQGKIEARYQLGEVTNTKTKGIGGVATIVGLERVWAWCVEEFQDEIRGE